MPGFRPQFDTAGNLQFAGSIGVARGSSVTTGGSTSTGVAITMSGLGDGPASGATTAAGLGIFFGAATPTFAAGTGSVFINTTPNTGVTSSNSRLFIATNAQGGWSGVTTLT